MTLLNETAELVHADRLKEHPSNPRRGDLERIQESIEHNGFYGTLVVQRSTGFILAGNHRFRAARNLGYTEFPVAWVDVTEDEAHRIMLADNRTGDVADYDNEALLALLTDLDGSDGTGYSPDDIEDLVSLLGAVPTAPVEEFKGGYADRDEDVEKLQGRAPVQALGLGRLEEVRLLMTRERYEDWGRNIAILRKAYGESGLVQVVFEAVAREAAKQG